MRQQFLDVCGLDAREQMPPMQPPAREAVKTTTENTPLFTGRCVLRPEARRRGLTLWLPEG